MALAGGRILLPNNRAVRALTEAFVRGSGNGLVLPRLIAIGDPDLLARVVDAGIHLEVCPVSNVALGVYSDLSSVPLPTLLEAGASVALGADDPLLFGSRLAAQYATMRAAHDLTDEQLAELARMSVRAARAPDATKQEILAAIDTWLATPENMDR